MFFTEYHPMTAEAVDKAVQSFGRADGSSLSLEGLSFTARLEGEHAPGPLGYEFLDEAVLAFTENGKRSECGYAASAVGPVVLISHLVPGSSRAFHLILDRETWALTVFETWFGITVPVGFDFTGKKPPEGWREIPREVQREYSFGWADTGSNEKPASLHAPTNRIEGRGLHWDYDDGSEILTFFPSTVACILVELGREKGGITMSNPADYIKIDDRRYVFARWECEFSGGMRLDVVDFYTMESAGLLFGFDENDRLGYRLRRAKLERTGDAAHLEAITDTGTARPSMARASAGKGMRYAYRPGDIDLPMTRAEALAHAARARRVLQDPEEITNPSQIFNTLPRSRALVGKTFRVIPDNETYAAAPWNGSGKEAETWEYDVFSEKYLRWRKGDGPWKEEKYACFESDAGLYFLGHLETDAEDCAMVAQAVDFDNGLATTVRTGVGNWRSEWECGASVRFGTVRGDGIPEPPFARRHRFTDDLVGCCFACNYNDGMNSIHIYSAPESLSWTIFKPDNGGGASWSSPGFFIRLRPDVYLLNWIEEKCNGSQGLLVINRKVLHDCGFFYGVNREGLRLEAAGAFMRELGHFDILKYYRR